MTTTSTTHNLRGAQRCVLAFFMSAAMCVAALAQGNPDWRQYTDRHGTRLDYPAGIFSETRAAENGVMLARADGRAELRIFTVANTRGDTPRSFLRREFPFDRSVLSYDRVTRDFFVVSARRKGRIVYTRCNFVERIHCIELSYPGGEKRAFDGVVTRISLSLWPRG